MKSKNREYGPMTKLAERKRLKIFGQKQRVGSNPTRATKLKIRLTQQLYNNTYQDNLLKKLYKTST